MRVSVIARRRCIGHAVGDTLGPKAPPRRLAFQRVGSWLARLVEVDRGLRHDDIRSPDRCDDSLIDRTK
jgi:hypothetical protein